MFDITKEFYQLLLELVIKFITDLYLKKSYVIMGTMNEKFDGVAE